MMMKRILFVLLAAICLAAAGFSHPVYAAEVIDGEKYNKNYNVSWQLTDDGVLTVSSPQGIYGDLESSRFPWYKYRDQIRKLVIEAGTKEIGSNAFARLDNLEELVLPKTLQIIGEGAFAYCTKLRSVELPDSVESIDVLAFAGCTSLERVKLPVNPKYTKVEKAVFASCPLVELDIPDQITHVEVNAFDTLTQLKELRIGEGLLSAKGLDLVNAYELEWAEIYCAGSIELKGKSKLCSVVLGPKANNVLLTDCTALETVVLQEGLTQVSSSAFQNCKKLKSIQLPSTLTVIGNQAFSGCPLKSVVLPNSLQEIGIWAFSGCPLESLELPHGLQKICELAFEGTRLRELTIPSTVKWLESNALSVTTLEKVVFLGDAPQFQYSPMKYTAPIAYYPAGNSTWTEEVRFAMGYSVLWESFCTESDDMAHGFSPWNCVTQPTTETPGWETRTCALCGTMEERIIQRLRPQEPPVIRPTEPSTPVEPSAPTEPGQPNIIKWLYDAKTGTATVTGGGVLTIQEFVDIFGDQPLRHLVIGEGIIEIGANGFELCRELESIVFPESLRIIGNGAFWACENLKSLEFPDGLLVLGERAFGACYDITQITFGSQLRSIGDECFTFASKITQLQLPDSLLYIGSKAFHGCEALQQVELGAGLHYLGSGAFANCGSLDSFRVSHDNRHFTDRDGVILSADEKTLLLYPVGRQGEYTIPSSVTRIAPRAFNGCNGLTAIHIPSTVKSIGEKAFMDCEGLVCVDMAEGVEVIEFDAFASCGPLRILTIPASVKQMTITGSYTAEMLQMVFLGERPEGVEPIKYMRNLVVYYPAGDSSWDVVRDESSVDSSWRALCAGEHTWVTVPGTTGNCLEKVILDGIVCSECGLIQKTQEEAGFGSHDFSPWQQGKAPTEMEEGWEARICSICREREERVIDKLAPTSPPESEPSSSESQPAPSETQPSSLEPQPSPSEPQPVTWLIAVIAVVAVSFVGVEVYLVRKKKKRA